MKFKHLAISGLLIVSSFGLLKAQSDSLSVQDTAVVIPPGFDNMLDYNLHQWALQNANYTSDCIRSDDSNVVTPEIYKERLKRLPWIMEMPYNSIVQSYIDLYIVRKRKQMEYMLGLGSYYYPIFEQVLAANNMPLELKYLPVIESALNPVIVSPMGAAGLWQFMIPTGRSVGLEINSLVDERLDPIKSTHAAARYLKELYSIYGDWHLVIAAYNCGPGNVRKAISRSGGKRDYWEIYPYLPAETRGYVPIFIAANYAMEYAAEHNLCPLVPPLPPITDTIHISERIHLQQISEVLNIPMESLKQVNPQYKKDIIPGSKEKTYTLCLPIRYIDSFLTQYDSIVNHKRTELVENRRSEVEAAQRTSPTNSKGGKVTYHTVRQGQTLSLIAQRHGVSVKNIQKWNGLKSTKIRSGQRLKIIK